jgi:hypothetical protein
VNKNVFFFFYKIGEQKGGTSPAWWGRVGASGSGEEVGRIYLIYS